MKTLFAILSLATIGLGAVVRDSTDTFDPYAFKLHTVTCPAVERVKNINTTLQIEYVEENPTAEKTLIFAHGWPSIWTVWGPQIVEFSKEYHVIALNSRGFGGSTFPGSVEEDGTYFDLVNDIKCVLDASKVSKAVCIGIDWGTQTCIEAARDLPDVIIAAAGTIMYEPTYTPPWLLAPTIPTFGYQVYFNNFTGKAAAELNTDIRRSLRAVYRSFKNPAPEGLFVSQSNFLGVYGNEPIEPIAFMNSRQEDYMVEQFERQGFEPGLFYYQNDNRVLTVEFDQAHSSPIIEQPVLFLAPADDPVIPDFIAAMDLFHAFDFLPNVQTVIINDSGHWVTWEQVEVYNQNLRTWLDTTAFA